MTLNSSRQPFLLLRCALAISVVLAFPIEQVMHDSYLSISSCSNEEIGLNLGNIVQAILTPIFIFLLPGPGSIFQKKVASSSLRRLSPVGAPVIPRSAVSARRSAVPMAVFLLALGLAMFLASGWSLKHWIGQSPMTSSPFANAAVAALLIIQLASSLVSIGAAIFLLRLHVLSEGALFIAAGCLCAVMISIAWWYGVQEYAELHGECAALYDWSLPVHSFKPDYVTDFFHYFIYLSGFSALWRVGSVCNPPVQPRVILPANRCVTSRAFIGHASSAGRFNIVSASALRSTATTRSGSSGLFWISFFSPLAPYGYWLSSLLGGRRNRGPGYTRSCRHIGGASRSSCLLR